MTNLRLQGVIVFHTFLIWHLTCILLMVIDHCSVNLIMFLKESYDNLLNTFCQHILKYCPKLTTVQTSTYLDMACSHRNQLITKSLHNWRIVNPYVGPLNFVMMLGPINGGNYVKVLIHVILANQNTYYFVYCWLRAHTTFYEHVFSHLPKYQM